MTSIIISTLLLALLIILIILVNIMHPGMPNSSCTRNQSLVEQLESEYNVFDVLPLENNTFIKFEEFNVVMFTESTTTIMNKKGRSYNYSCPH